MTVLRENALGVELHSFDVNVAMAHSHDEAVLCRCRDAKR